MSSAITYFMTYVLEAGLAFYYIDRVFLCKKSRVLGLLATLVLYLLQFAFSFLKIPFLNCALFLLSNALIILFFYECRFITAFFHSLLLTLLMTITEVVAGNAIGSIYTDFDVADMKYNIFILYFIFSKTAYMLLLFIALKFVSKRRNIFDSRVSIFAPAMMMFSALLIVVSYFYICDKVELPRDCEWLLVVCSLIILFVSILSIWLYEYTIKNAEKITELQLEIQSEKDTIYMTEKMSELYENQKIMIHDIKNHLKAIQGYMLDKNYEETGKYLNNLIGMPALNKRTNYSGSKRLNILLERFDNMCDGKNIDLCVDIKADNIDYIRPEDMTSLFGNLFDNAIEAATGCPDALIELVIREHNSALQINMMNSCMIRPQFGHDGRLITTKKDRYYHGFGMKSISKIVKKYHGEFDCYYDDQIEMFKINIRLRL